MKKTAILPIIAVLCLAVTAFTGIEISSDLQEEIAGGIAVLVGAGLSIWGIYKDHKKKGDK